MLKQSKEEVAQSHYSAGLLQTVGEGVLMGQRRPEPDQGAATARSRMSLGAPLTGQSEERDSAGGPRWDQMAEGLGPRWKPVSVWREAQCGVTIGASGGTWREAGRAAGRSPGLLRIRGYGTALLPPPAGSHASPHRAQPRPVWRLGAALRWNGSRGSSASPGHGAGCVLVFAVSSWEI